MRLTKLGHSCVRLDKDGAILVIDQGGWSDPAAALDGAAAVLVTHEHPDHLDADAIRAALSEAGIASATYYTTPLHLQPALRFLGYEPGSLPATEQAGTENFSLPLWPGIPTEAQERVVDVVRSAVPSRV